MQRRHFLRGMLAWGLLPWLRIETHPARRHWQADRVENLLQTLTLRQKVGQLFMGSLAGTGINDGMRRLIRDYHLGGFFIFDYNVAAPALLTQLANDLQSAATLPLFLAVDQEGGKVQRLRGNGFTDFPSPMALGAANDLALTERIGAAMAAELAACGLNMNLAPVLDVNSQPLNPIINTRAFGGDSLMVAAHGAAFVRGTQAAGVVATAKHFPGHGNTIEDSHYTLPVVPGTQPALYAEIEPFAESIAAQVGGVMTAHVMYPALDGENPATFSHPITTDLLRTRLGFEGVVLTDALTMAGANQGRDDLGSLLRDVLEAGGNLLSYGALPGGGAPSLEGQIAAVETVIQLAEGGELSPELLDTAVRQILQVKAQFGILDAAPLDPATTLERLDFNAHTELCREVAEKSITLYRDQVRLLPLDANAPLALLYPAELPQLADAFADGLPNLVRLPYSVNAGAGEAAALAAQVGSRTALCLTFDAERYPGQAGLISALPVERTLILATQSPYDLLQFPAAPTYLMSYGISPAALMAARRVIFGELSAWGSLPVGLG